MKKMRGLYFLVILFTTSVVMANPLMEKANELYRKEKYAEAIQSYEKVLKTKHQSVALYYNLANAHYKLNHIAPSIYYYEKALMLDSSDEEVLNNLQFAQAMTIDDIKAVSEVGILAWIKGISGLFHYNTWAIISVFVAVLISVFFAIYYFSTSVNTKRYSFITMLIFNVLLVIVLSIGFFAKSMVESENPAIVFANTAPVKNEPNMNAEDTFVLHEGTKVFVKEKYSEWCKVALSNGSEGWIQSQSIKEVKSPF